VSTISVITMSMHGSVCTAPRRVTLPGGDCRHLAPGHNRDFSATAALVTGMSSHAHCESDVAGAHIYVRYHLPYLSQLRAREPQQQQAAGGCTCATTDECVSLPRDGAVSSPVLPPAVYAVCLADHTVRLQHRRPLAAPLTALGLTHECHREHATAADGTLVPVTIAHRRGLVLDGSHPLCLLGTLQVESPLRNLRDRQRVLRMATLLSIVWAMFPWRSVRRVRHPSGDRF
jgi:hypothetical protein